MRGDQVTETNKTSLVAPPPVSYVPICTTWTHKIKFSFHLVQLKLMVFIKLLYHECNYNDDEEMEIIRYFHVIKTLIFMQQY